MFCICLKYLIFLLILSLVRKGIYCEEGCEYMFMVFWNDVVLVDKEK